MKKLLHSISCLCAVLLMTACEMVPSVSFSLNPNSLQMKVGDIANIDVVGSATNIEWTSSNESVATVFHGVIVGGQRTCAIGAGDIPFIALLAAIGGIHRGQIIEILAENQGI